eukprot:jgi/Astpho2/4031/e_gw1.00063.104.1_t
MHCPAAGAGTPPKYGDFEAQRHWMEITTHLPVKDWYKNTTLNNLEYWGLDYPPLSAYQAGLASWLCGKIVGHFDPAAVALNSSSGYETPFSKGLMRWTVIAADILIHFPASIFSTVVFARGRGLEQQAWLLLLLLLQPAALIIDHGHFQYNNISLGLTAAAAAAVAAHHDVLGSIAYCLAINHKQMSLYFAPAFFGHLLGKCLRQPGARKASAKHAAQTGRSVLLTFAVCWAPWLLSQEAALGVLQRVLPVKRGLYEDYVGNFWCATNFVVKWRKLYEQQVLVKLCAAVTLGSCLPAMAQQLLKPSSHGLLRCMACSALGFFLFSYQVHEKSILMPLLPLTMLALEHPAMSSWLPIVGMFSMYPLIRKDGLSLAYAAMMMLWTSVASPGSSSRGTGSILSISWTAPQAIAALSILGGIVVHGAHLLVPPPDRYPFMYDAAYIILSAAHHITAWLYLNWQQWRSSSSPSAMKQD